MARPDERTVLEGGVLIAGSLWWDNGIRERWRTARLATEQAWNVEAPSRYGRRSENRRRTFTMTLDAEIPSGVAKVVPFRRPVRSFEELLAEAQALWRAEAKTPNVGPVSSPWGTVGALFRTDGTMAERWSAYFARNGQVIHPVDERGLLQLAWPRPIDDSNVDSLDLLLAVSTVAVSRRVSPSEVASAWSRHGHEEYFFMNVANGLRTADDLDIWESLILENPKVRERPEYQDAIGILDHEIQNTR